MNNQILISNQNKIIKLIHKNSQTDDVASIKKQSQREEFLKSQLKENVFDFINIKRIKFIQNLKFPKSFNENRFREQSQFSSLLNEITYINSNFNENCDDTIIVRNGSKEKEKA